MTFFLPIFNKLNLRKLYFSLRGFVHDFIQIAELFQLDFVIMSDGESPSHKKRKVDDMEASEEDILDEYRKRLYNN